MGTMEMFLCVFLCHFIAAQPVIKRQDASFFQGFPRFFDKIRPPPFERNFDFTPFDTIFSSWRTPSPDFHMLAELPPIMIMPRVEVLCDESKLTLLVDKTSNGVVLTAGDIQLGDGCYSNRELPNQYVFTYSLNECGTTHVMQNGRMRFINTLHLNLKKPPTNWWQSPSTVHISCLPKWSSPNYFDSATFPEDRNTFNIKAMNPSWTSTAQSNIYKRGQVVNFQVSAKTRPEQQQQQLFIQSCFVSASPEHQTRSRHAVIMNKGCTAPLGSSHALVQFVASDRPDVVNFALNTSYLIAELYVHCTVLVSDQGLSSGLKSCNYNMFQSRWEDLSGNVEVCECCSSRCRGLSVRHLPEDAKATVSIGPMVVVDNHVETTSPEPPVSVPPEPSSTPDIKDSAQSDGSVTEDTIVSGASVSRPPQGVVVVSRDPLTRLTLWLPGQVRDAEHSGSSSEDSNELPEMQPSTTNQEPLLKTLPNEIREEPGSDGHTVDVNVHTLLDGWAIPPRMQQAAFEEESQRKRRFERSETVTPQEVDVPLTAEITLTVLNQNDFDQMKEKLADEASPQEETNDAPEIIRSKLEFSRTTDGTKTLSYEEEVMKQQEGNDVIRRFGKDGIKRKPEPRQRGLRSAFLDLLRRLDKAE